MRSRKAPNTDTFHAAQYLLTSFSTKGTTKEEVFLKVSQILQKTSVLECLFNNVAGLRACKFVKKIFQHRCFPVKFATFLRTPTLTNVCEQLLLFLVIWLNSKSFFRNKVTVRLQQHHHVWRKATTFDNTLTKSRRYPSILSTVITYYFICFFID